MDRGRCRRGTARQRGNFILLTGTGHMRARVLVDTDPVRGHYLPEGEPDLEDFFAQVAPTPPPTDRPGGVLFMAPFDPPLDRWFAYVRWGPHVDRFTGSQESVCRWARSQDVTERWIYQPDAEAYVPWPEEAGAGHEGR
ncbi:hypothetical protein GCM10023153_12720 [Ornithinibacter aureus]|uniref:Uncharacterized protein n=1 Tax=Ornithinibacter aureus TaxID=622664 RepID=A0ABP8JM63_9MICO